MSTSDTTLSSDSPQEPPPFSLFAYRSPPWFTLLSLTATLVYVARVLGVDFLLGFSGFFYACLFVTLLAAVLTPVARGLNRLPFLATLIVTPVLYYLLEFVFYQFDLLVNHSEQLINFSQFTRRDWQIFIEGSLYLMAIPAFIVALDAPFQDSRPRDPAYFPCVANIPMIFRRPRLRLAFLVGVLLVLGFYTFTVAEVFRIQQYGVHMIRPSHRVFIACNLLWITLWVADCYTRPGLGPIVAAHFCLIAGWMFFPHINIGVVRE